MESWITIKPPNEKGEVNRRYAEESFSSTPITHLIFHFIFISFSLISVVLSKQVSYRYHGKRKSPINGSFTPFMKLYLLFKLLGGEIYPAVSQYTFVYFILHIHLILLFCVLRLKFLEPKQSHYNF